MRYSKTITVDNGSEFADADGIERSARRKDASGRRSITAMRIALVSAARTRILTA